jgi:hypothetical protein
MIELPLCACEEFYSAHHPQCPARHHSEQLQAENNRLRNAWISVDERLPEFNVLVWAFLDGEKEHSGVRWVRRGAAEMIRNNFGGTRSTVHDEWDRGHYDAALKRIDADMAMVTHWQPLPKEPSE